MKRKVIGVLVPTFFGLIIVILGILVGYGIGRDVFEYTSGIKTAEPIYQQQIGDEAEPDILIIYEAEIDGVKVYPSVIKESE